MQQVISRITDARLQERNGQRQLRLHATTKGRGRKIGRLFFG